MFRFPSLLICVGLLIALTGASHTSVAATIGNKSYFLPLIAPYGVHRTDPHFPNAKWGAYQLVRQSSPASDGGQFVVLQLQRVAVVAPFIVGQDATGYFLLDSRDPNVLHAQQFSEKEKWEAALKAAGLPANIQLSNPDTLAAQLTDQAIHPENYVRMHGLFGLSDGAWSAIIQLIGLLFAFIVALFVRSTSAALNFAVVLGIAVDIVAQILISGGGPGAFVGFFMFPIIYATAAMIARGLRKLMTSLGRFRRVRLSPPA